MDLSKTLNWFVKIVTWISLSWAYRLARFCKVPPYKTAPRWQEGQKVSEINQAGEKRQIGQICTFQFSNLIFSSLTCRKEIIGHMLGVARIEGWKCHLSIDKTLKEKNISIKFHFLPSTSNVSQSAEHLKINQSWEWEAVVRSRYWKYWKIL